MTETDSMDIHEVLQSLPHRYPFLLVDRVTACKPGEYLDAIKNVTMNEPYFVGHFPIRPVMPGVLIIEALAQASALLAFATAQRTPEDDMLYYFAGIDKARFKRPVEPGDQLVLHVELLRAIKGLWKFSAEASVDGKAVAKAELMCAPRKVDS